MPIPSKKDKESQKDFMDRCIIDNIMQKEFKDIKQRIAVCLTKYKENNKDANTKQD